MIRLIRDWDDGVIRQQLPESFTFCVTCVNWRRGGLMVSALVPGSSGRGSSFDRGHSVVLLSQCLSPPSSINGYRRIVGET